MSYFEKIDHGFAFTTKTGIKIEFDDRYGDLTIRFADGTQETTRLTAAYKLFTKQDIDDNNIKVINGTIWKNTNYVPLGEGCYMKQDEYKKKIKDKGLKTPVLSVIQRTYEDR